MADKYLVHLTREEQGYLLDVVRKGKTTARRVARAHVLLRAAEGVADEEIAETLHLGLSTVHRTRQRFVDEGLTAALSERPRAGSPPVLTGKQAAFLVALACSTPPAGRRRWTNAWPIGHIETRIKLLKNETPLPKPFAGEGRSMSFDHLQPGNGERVRAFRCEVRNSVCSGGVAAAMGKNGMAASRSWTNRPKYPSSSPRRMISRSAPPMRRW